jgi:hypothetical protein
MSQMNKKKNHNTDQKMSANETSATTIGVSSLSMGAERDKHCGPGGDTPWGEEGSNSADGRSR